MERNVIRGLEQQQTAIADSAAFCSHSLPLKTLGRTLPRRQGRWVLFLKAGSVGSDEWRS